VKDLFIKSSPWAVNFVYPDLFQIFYHKSNPTSFSISDGGKAMDFQENNGYNAGVLQTIKRTISGIRKSREIIWRLRGCHADIELDREEGG
jgi:hypothetical protein